MSYRYTRILSAAFGSTALPLPLSAHVYRRVEALPAAGQADAYQTSVQIGPCAVTAELRIRGIAATDSLSLGTKAALSITIAGASADQAVRTITLTGAVLVGLETAYEQSSMAVATLTFHAEAADGATNPFHAEDSL